MHSKRIYINDDFEVTNKERPLGQMRHRYQADFQLTKGLYEDKENISYIPVSLSKPEAQSVGNFYDKNCISPTQIKSNNYHNSSAKLITKNAFLNLRNDFVGKYIQLEEVEPFEFVINNPNNFSLGKPVSPFNECSDTDSSQNDSPSDTDDKEFSQYSHDFRNFGLVENSTEPSSPSGITHQYLPVCSRNDEYYKSRLFKYLKNPINGNSKTDTCKALYYRKHSQLYGKLTY